MTDEPVVILGLSDHLVTREPMVETSSRPSLPSENDPARRIVEFNRDELSTVLGYRWQNTAPVEWSRISESKKNNLQRLATLLIQEIAEKEGSLLIEDASMGCFLPFWNEILRRVGFTIKAVCITRGSIFESPAIIQSNRLTARHSYITWTNYWLMTITNLQLVDQVYVDFDLLSSDFENQFSRIEKALGVSKRSWLAARLEQWIKEIIQMHVRGFEDLEISNNDFITCDLPRVTRDLYVQITGLCREEYALPQNQQIKELMQQHRSNVCILRSHDIYFNELLNCRRKIALLDASVKGYLEYLSELSPDGVQSNMNRVSMTDTSKKVGQEPQVCNSDRNGRMNTAKNLKSQKLRNDKEAGSSASPSIASFGVTARDRTVSSELGSQHLQEWQQLDVENTNDHANSVVINKYADPSLRVLLLLPSVILRSSFFNSHVIQSFVRDESVYIYSDGDDPSIELPRLMDFEGRVDLEIDIELPGERLVQLYYLENWFQDFEEQYSFAVSLPMGRHQICWTMPLAFSGVIRLDPGNGIGLYRLFSIKAVIRPF